MCPTGSRRRPWLPCAPPPLLSAPLIPTASAMLDTLASRAATSEEDAGWSASRVVAEPAGKRTEEHT